MKLSITNDDLRKIDSELFIAGMFEGQNPQEAGFEELDKFLDNKISLALKRGDFEGKPGQELTLYGNNPSGLNQVTLVGLGKNKNIDNEEIRRSFGKIGKNAAGKNLQKLSLTLSSTFEDQDSHLQAIVAACEGVSLAMYKYPKYRSREIEDHKLIECLTLYCSENNSDLYNQAAQIADCTIEGTCFARDLVAMPAMDLYPGSLAEIARELASETIKVEILEGEKLEELNMKALLAVGQGSAKPPCLIHLVYDPGIKDAKTFAIVGKGLTFDAGGLDLKSAAGMRDMKTDMAGSATVMGIFKVLEKWKPQCRVEGFVAAAENMPGGNAYRPGDVIGSYRGLSIEIDNTDAEGRLTLADALAYAVDTAKPGAIVDLATLTGACVIALGHHATGLMSNNDELSELIGKAGDNTGEKTWRLPLWKDYKKQISSVIADLKNTGGRPAGAITAGAFLEEFVDNVPWVHLDIAGTATEVSYSYTPHKELPSGVGVRLLLETLRNWA